MTDSCQCSQHPWCITIPLIEYNIVQLLAISAAVGLTRQSNHGHWTHGGSVHPANWRSCSRGIGLRSNESICANVTLLSLLAYDNCTYTYVLESSLIVYTWLLEHMFGTWECDFWWVTHIYFCVVSISWDLYLSKRWETLTAIGEVAQKLCTTQNGDHTMFGLTRMHPKWPQVAHTIVFPLLQLSWCTSVFHCLYLIIFTKVILYMHNFIWSN